MAARLYGMTEVADAIGAKLNTVSVWYRRGKLPEPSAVLAMGPVWTAAKIEPWLREHRA